MASNCGEFLLPILRVQTHMWGWGLLPPVPGISSYSGHFPTSLICSQLDQEEFCCSIYAELGDAFLQKNNKLILILRAALGVWFFFSWSVSTWLWKEIMCTGVDLPPHTRFESEEWLSVYL